MGGIYAVSAHIIGPSLATMTQARYEAFEKVESLLRVRSEVIHSFLGPLRRRSLMSLDIWCNQNIGATLLSSNLYNTTVSPLRQCAIGNGCRLDDCGFRRKCSLVIIVRLRLRPSQQAHLSASNPVSKFWDHPLVSEESSNVYDYPAFLIAMSSIDLIFDLVILSLPLPVIKNLHLSLRRKWTLAGIFMLGFL